MGIGANRNQNALLFGFFQIKFIQIEAVIVGIKLQDLFIFCCGLNDFVDINVITLSP